MQTKPEGLIRVPGVAGLELVPLKKTLVIGLLLVGLAAQPNGAVEPAGATMNPVCVLTSGPAATDQVCTFHCGALSLLVLRVTAGANKVVHGMMSCGGRSIYCVANGWATGGVGEVCENPTLGNPPMETVQADNTGKCRIIADVGLSGGQVECEVVGGFFSSPAPFACSGSTRVPPMSPLFSEGNCAFACRQGMVIYASLANRGVVTGTCGGPVVTCSVLGSPPSPGSPIGTVHGGQCNEDSTTLPAPLDRALVNAPGQCVDVGLGTFSCAGAG